MLPIGGPGEAITPRAQGKRLCALLGREPRITPVPVALLDAVIAVLGTLGRVMPSLVAEAELARIGRWSRARSRWVGSRL